MGGMFEQDKSSSFSRKEQVYSRRCQPGDSAALHASRWRSFSFSGYIQSEARDTYLTGTTFSALETPRVSYYDDDMPEDADNYVIENG
ncbi:hypothetical protein EW145_g7562 [Phellinidium pouzarii]|uniref:Uncharacterized protein n=1 Tax=Phellinidium pouzarii TaxID=167371 RepID=A0A4S4KHF2_9AGAM|nr:hypothetical protein EW145_g7562 [Phellinidium pouzarii]